MANKQTKTGSQVFKELYDMVTLFTATRAIDDTGASEEQMVLYDLLEEIEQYGDINNLETE